MKRQTVSLFPLKSVLFPGTLLQLKVFEARYLDLASQCLREKTPFGVVCLAAGKEAGRGNVRFESHGVLAHIDTVDAEGANLLKLRCLGIERFTLVGKPAQEDNGLWTSEIDFRFQRSAYWIAARTSRSVPSREAALIPIPDVAGNRIFFTPISFWRKAITFWASALSAAHSMPA